jgi:hypothetical protein
MNVSLSRQIRPAIFTLLAGTMAFCATSAPAQTGAAVPPNVAGDCDRACLQGLAEQFIAALVAHDPGMARGPVSAPASTWIARSR